MPNQDVVVIGAPAGGIETLQALCSCLPPTLDARMMIAMHTSPFSNGLLRGSAWAELELGKPALNRIEQRGWAGLPF